VSGGWTNSLSAAFEAIEGFISGQRVNLIVSCGINDILNSGINLNLELVVSRLLSQVLYITNKRKMNAVLITSILPAGGFEDLSIKADFLIHLLGLQRFRNAAFIKMAKCFLIPTRANERGSYKIDHDYYSADGIHFSHKGRKRFKLILKHWINRMNDLKQVLYSTKIHSVLHHL
jgi:hypothetical protein